MQPDIAQRSARGSFALFVGNFLSTVISFVAVIFIARFLGPDSYGVYTLCILVPNVLLNFLGLGVNSGITRYAASTLSQQNSEAARRYLVSGAIFVLLSGAALTLVDFVASGFVATLFHRPEITYLLRLSSLIILAHAVFQSGIAGLLGWSYMGRIAGTNIVQSALRLVLVVPIVLLGYEVYGALTAYFLSVLLGGFVAYYLLWREMRGYRVSSGQFLSDVRVLLSYGRELFIGSLATSFSAQYVVALLALVASNAYIGYYQSASNFVTAITLTSGAITQALFPAFAHLEGVGSDVRNAFSFAVKYMGFAITPIIFLLMGASLQVIRLPLGSSYVTAAYFLALLAFSNIPMLFGIGVLPSFFNGLGRPRYYMLYSLATFAVLVVLAPALAIGAGLGVVGLILSMLVANATGLVAGLYLASRFLDSRVDYRASISILASSLLAYLATLAVSRLAATDFVLLPLEVIVFAAVYLTAAPLVRAIDPEDIKILESAFSGLGRFERVVRPLLQYEAFVLRAAGIEKPSHPT